MTKTPSKAPSQRQLRVGEEIRHALSEVLARGELRDPDLVDVSLTVSEVRISPDLRNATAFVMPLGGVGEDRAALLAALGRAAMSAMKRAMCLRMQGRRRISGSEGRAEALTLSICATRSRTPLE